MFNLRCLITLHRTDPHIITIKSSNSTTIHILLLRQYVFKTLGPKQKESFVGSFGSATIALSITKFRVLIFLVNLSDILQSCTVSGSLYSMIILNPESDSSIGFSWYIGISCWGGAVGWVRKEKTRHHGPLLLVSHLKYTKQNEQFISSHNKDTKLITFHTLAAAACSTSGGQNLAVLPKQHDTSCTAITK